MPCYEIPSWAIARWWREKVRSERCLCGTCEEPGVCVMAPIEDASAAEDDDV
jgi:hypothetical protein